MKEEQSVMFSRRRENTKCNPSPQKKIIPKHKRPKILLCSEAGRKSFLGFFPPPWNAAVELALVNCEEEQQRPPAAPPVAPTLSIRSDKVAVALD